MKSEFTQIHMQSDTLTQVHVHCILKTDLQKVAKLHIHYHKHGTLFHWYRFFFQWANFKEWHTDLLRCIIFAVAVHGSDFDCVYMDMSVCVCVRVLNNDCS